MFENNENWKELYRNIDKINQKKHNKMLRYKELGLKKFSKTLL